MAETPDAASAAAFHGLALNKVHPEHDRLACALTALKFYTHEHEALVEAGWESVAALQEAYVAADRERTELRKVVEVLAAARNEAYDNTTKLLEDWRKLHEHILDIDAHATPYGDLPGEPGWVGTYLVAAGALHRALGKIGHSAPSCQAEAERDEARAHLDRALKVVQAAQAYCDLDTGATGEAHRALWAAVDAYNTGTEEAADG